MREPSGVSLILIRQADQRTLSLYIPGTAILIATLALVVLAGMAAWHSYLLGTAQQQRIAVARERDELAQVASKQAGELSQWQAEVQKLAAAVQQLEAEQKALQELEARVRDMLGGRGGPDTGSPETLAPDEDEGASAVELMGRLQTLTAEQQKRAGALTQAASDLEKHLAYLAAKPSGWPAAGWRTDGYGWRNDPFGRGRRFHEGVDIAGAHGTDVVATADGVVSFAGWKAGGYGLTVIIDHGYGFRTLYAHNSANLVKQGDPVKRGQPIGRMGSTGHSTGPHVHYEIYVWGRQVDPETYLD